MTCKYTPWYKIMEEVFGSSVPHKSDDEISGYISREDWMIVPLSGETDKNKSKAAQRPNLYFSLRHEGTISFGIAYDKLACVNKFRDIILPFNEKERSELLKKLSILNDDVLTVVSEKIKYFHRLERPNYNEVFSAKSNEMNLDLLKQAFKEVDKIIAKRECLDSNQKFQLAPTIDIVTGETEANEKAFRDILLKIKPIYDMTVNLRTENDFDICNGCLCFSCEEKGQHELCKCPCPGFPKHVGRKTYCSSRIVNLA